MIFKTEEIRSDEIMDTLIRLETTMDRIADLTKQLYDLIYILSDADEFRGTLKGLAKAGESEKEDDSSSVLKNNDGLGIRYIDDSLDDAGLARIVLKSAREDI